MWWGNGSMVGHSCCHTHTNTYTHTPPHATRASTIIIFLVEWDRHWDCRVGEMQEWMWDLIQSQQVLVFAFALGVKLHAYQRTVFFPIVSTFSVLLSPSWLLLEGHYLLWNAAHVLFSEVCKFLKRKISLINLRSQCHFNLCTGFC